MKPCHPIRLPAGLALAWVGCLAAAYGQEPQRFMVEPVDPRPTVSPHQGLLDSVRGIGGIVYADVDFPAIAGNLVGVLLDPLAAQDLRNTRPDLIVIPDRELQPAAAAGVPWSLDRIDQRVGGDSAYLPAEVAPCGDARPFIYLCDTGVLGMHDEFATAGARLSLAGSYIPATLPRTFSAWEDPWDHGTGVASCAIGETLGAGRCPANLVSAVCYPDPGSFSAPSFASFAADVIYWSLNEHNLRAADDDPFNDASVLIFASSTTTGPSALLDLAVQRAYLAGMTVVVAAGNANSDVSTTSPAGAVSGMFGDITLTVAGSTLLDARWAGSNFGSAVELFAPGKGVLAASASGVSLCGLRDGTSYAAGYVGGAAARLLARNPWAAPAQVAKALTDPSDVTFGPSGSFGAGMNGVPRLLFVNPGAIACVRLTFSEWMDRFGASPDGATDDADRDGLPNAVEYLMALDPTRWDGDGAWMELQRDEEGTRFRFRLAGFLCESLNYEVQHSTDLIHWTAVTQASIVDDETAPCSDGSNWMVAPLPAGGERRFVRLVVLGF